MNEYTKIHSPAEIYEKFCNGDSLSDSDLEIGIYHFKNTGELLSASGPVFKLAANEAWRVALRLEDFYNERKAP